MSSPLSSSPPPAASFLKLLAPPPLPYNLHSRRLSIALVWTLLFLITSAQVEFFYFILRYVPHNIKPSTPLTVATSILLGLSIFSIAYRTWQLMKRGSTCRPVGGKWWTLDYFHLNAILGFVIVTAVLSVATSDDEPNIRQSSMPQTILLYLACSQLIITGVLAHLKIRTPLSLSSTFKGTIVRPGVFILMEDIVAVDGGGGVEYREALVERYEGSPVFRTMLVRLNWFWGIGGLSVAAAMTGVIYGVQNEDVVFALGWCVPWVWAALWAILTGNYTKRMLRTEEMSFQGVPDVQEV